MKSTRVTADLLSIKFCPREINQTRLVSKSCVCVIAECWMKECIECTAIFKA